MESRESDLGSDSLMLDYRKCAFKTNSYKIAIILMSLHLLDFHNLWYLVETSRKTPRPACRF